MSLLWFVSSYTLLKFNMIVLFLFITLGSASTSVSDGKGFCPKICRCLESFVDCSGKELKQLPSDLPSWTKTLDLTNNSFQDSSVLNSLVNCAYLKELKCDTNQFSRIPITFKLQNLTLFSISNNKISSLDRKLWSLLPNLKLLDLSFNRIESLSAELFPKSSDLTVLNLNNNKISTIDNETFDGFRKLKELRLSKNSLDFLGKVFKQLSNLRLLEMNRNKFSRIEGLTFKGLDNLQILKIRQNLVSSLEDGSFWGLQNLQVLRLDYNKITSVAKGWTYGLSSLRELYLGMNQICYIERDAWDACKNLLTLDLSNNDLSEIRQSFFYHLQTLYKLRLDHNKITFIHDGTFNSTPSLKILDLGHNKISWLIEDSNGVFSSLTELKKLGLASNEITSVNQKAFQGLINLSELDLTGNHIKTIQENAFVGLNLESLLINTNSFICDCSLTWLQVWLTNNSISLHDSFCAYPESLKGKNFISIPPQGFLCSNNESPKPIITQGPESTVTVAGSKINMSCSAWSSSNSTLKFKWKQNNNAVDPKYSTTINNTAYLHFDHIMLSHAGIYQCIVFNDFGPVYSKKASLKVLVLPVLVKKPGNLTVKAGSTAKLECAATGEPTPQLSWQKDGGTEFPAALERRMIVMPSDDEFFILNAKPTDSGLYSCIAKNSAGTVKANATLTVHKAPSLTKKMEDKEVQLGKSAVFECLGSGWPKPKVRWWKDDAVLTSSHRHFLAASDQLLIITDIKDADAGKYQCEMSNDLGNEKTAALLTIKPGYIASCENITGVIIITVVCCAVGTSAVWVIIIYQTRRYFSSRAAPKDVNTKVSDNKSDNSSTSKDSGTGNSTKRSTEDFQLEVYPTHDSLVDVQEVQEASGQVKTPLLQKTFCPETEQVACSCTHVQFDNTHSNHERNRNDRPFSAIVNKVEMPVVEMEGNRSYSCLYNSGKPTAV